MNYIKQLQCEVDARGVKLDDALDELCGLQSYLLSDKFKIDPTVQVRDVLNRIESVRVALCR